MMDKKRVFNFIYYLYVVLFYFYFFINTTMVSFDRLNRPLGIVLYFIALLVVLKVALEWHGEWKNKHVLIAVMGVLLLIPGAILYNRYHILLYVVAILGAKTVNRDNLFRLLLMEVYLLTSITVLLCAFGVIDNMVTYRNESSAPRYALGFIYTTYFSGYLLVIIALWAYIRKEAAKWFEIAIMAFLAFLCQSVSNARIDCLTGAMIVVSVIVFKISKQKGWYFKFLQSKCFIVMSSLCAPLLAIISIIMAVVYRFDSSFWTKIDAALSHRPYSNAITFQRYPMTMWGQGVLFHNNIEQGMVGIPEYYYVINCSYIEILALIGVGGLIAMLFMWVLLSYREVKRREYVRLGIFIAYGLLFFLEQRLQDFAINPFFVLLLCDNDDMFFDLTKLRRFILKYKLDKLCKPILTALILSIILELTIFNFESFTSSANDAITTSELYFGSVDLKHIEETDTYTYDNNTASIEVGNVYFSDALESILIELNLYSLGNNHEYRLQNDIEYDVDINYYNGEDFCYLDSKTIKSGDIKSGYIPLHVDRNIQYFRVDFHFPDKYMVEVYKMDFNTPVPFKLSFPRILIGCVILSIMLIIMKNNNVLDKLFEDRKKRNCETEEK